MIDQPNSLNNNTTDQKVIKEPKLFQTETEEPLKNDKEDKSSNKQFYVCSSCKKRFYSPKSLKMHINSHSLPILSCHICSKVYKKKKYLLLHTALHKEESKRRSTLKKKLKPYQTTQKTYENKYENKAILAELAEVIKGVFAKVSDISNTKPSSESKPEPDQEMASELMVITDPKHIDFLNGDYKDNDLISFDKCSDSEIVDINMN